MVIVGRRMGLSEGQMGGGKLCRTLFGSAQAIAAVVWRALWYVVGGRIPLNNRKRDWRVCFMALGPEAGIMKGKSG